MVCDDQSSSSSCRHSQARQPDRDHRLDSSPPGAGTCRLILHRRLAYFVLNLGCAAALILVGHGDGKLGGNGGGRTICWVAAWLLLGWLRLAGLVLGGCALACTIASFDHQHAPCLRLDVLVRTPASYVARKI